MIQPIKKIYYKALKKAEKILDDQQFVSDLMDKAFSKLGNLTEQFYDGQDQLTGMLKMVRSWAKREYTEVSPKAIISMLAAIIYFVNPFDFISDFIPFIGFLDDITIITYVVTVFNKEIERFMDWEKGQSTTN